MNYGGRGIEFRFSTGSDMAEWVITNLGKPRGRTLDRIDNNGHYEPGNLRWASAAQQARNKRPYRGSKYGERIRTLLDARGNDICYETVRAWINEGLTDDEILSRRRTSSGRPRVRHRERGAAKALHRER